MYIVYVDKKPEAVFKGEAEGMAFAKFFQDKVTEIKYMPGLTKEIHDCIVDQAEKHYFFINGHTPQYDKGYQEGYDACKNDVLELLNGGNKYDIE